jgi:hypothetical protein
VKPNSLRRKLRLLGLPVPPEILSKARAERRANRNHHRRNGMLGGRPRLPCATRSVELRRERQRRWLERKRADRLCAEISFHQTRTGKGIKI